jgi:hypothetical protein
MGFYDAGKDRLILGLWVRNLLWDTDLGSHPASRCPSSPSRVPKATTHRFRTAKSTSAADDRRKFVRPPSTRCNLLRTVVVMLFSVGGNDTLFFGTTVAFYDRWYKKKLSGRR